MKQALFATFPVALALLATASDASDRRRSDQALALEAQRSGRLLPVREIERRVLPSMAGARYLGFEFDSGAAIYTLKFLRGGTVIWVDVDGQSGQVLGSSGR